MAESYPLQQILQIKEKRLEEAEKTLIEKRNQLKEEEEQLLKLQKKRDEVKKHRDDKINQLKEELDEGTTSDKIEQAQRYLQVVDEKLLSREKKVAEQKTKVKAAEEAVEEAKKEVLRKQVDIEKITIHKNSWTKEMKMEEARIARVESDELGSGMFVRRRKKK
ncbi:MAG: type III secretion T3S chaperone [Rhabdochlamydiaceae bacterium]|nr:type III secretion T3S chaperone [Candidatus Amphrikana amoebophyrae]